MLLEKNQELHDENEALRAQLEIFENERPGLKSALTARDDEVAGLAEERRKCLVEINSLRNGLKAKSAMVTDLLDREQRYKGEIEEAEAAKRLAEYQLEILQLEFNELQRKESEKAGDASKTNGLHQYSVTNPAATYDSNQASVFTWADYEELMQKWQATSEENEALQLELKSVRKEVDNVRKKAAKTTEYYLQVEKLEKKNMKLQHANDALSEELSEERLVLESVRTMNLMYKVWYLLRVVVSVLVDLTVLLWLSLCLRGCSKSLSRDRFPWTFLATQQLSSRDKRCKSSASRFRTCSWRRT